MYRTFNMGIGMMVIVDEEKIDDIVHRFTAHGEEVVIIGEICAMHKDDEEQVELVF